MKKEPSARVIRSILRKHFPRATIRNIERITEGYSHYMYECTLNDKVAILRISFNKKYNVSIGKEVWVMQQYKRVGVPVPKIYAFHTGKEFDYLLMQKLDGQVLENVWTHCIEAERVQIAKEIGILLRQMHSVPLTTFGQVGPKGVVEDDFSFRHQAHGKNRTSDWVYALFSAGLKDLSLVIAQELITPQQTSEIVEYLHKHAVMMRHCKPTLTHVDFSFAHIFVQKVKAKWKITGLIDFEFACAFAPEFDFIKLHRAGILDDKKVKNAMLQAYGAKKLHQNFDTVVLVYRIMREIGFAGYVAKAGNITAARKTVRFILKTVQG